MQQNERKKGRRPQHRSRIDRRKREIARRRRQHIRIIVLVCLLIPMIAFPVWFLKSKSSEKKTATVAAQKEGEKKQEDEKPAKTPPKTENPAIVQEVDEDTIIFMGLGDMLFDRQVATLIKDKGIGEIFADVEDILRSGDVVAGNLECPLSMRGNPVEGKEYTFRGLPEAAGGMKNAGINVVSLANNHMMDYGRDALADTTELLDKAGIAHAGAGSNLEEAYKPAIINAKGKKIAFFAYTSILPEGFWATSKRPGVAGTRVKWNQLQDIIEKTKKDNDYVVVSFHWGIEYEDHPQEYQREFAKRVIDAGADIVIGHHPHVIQGIEIYKGKLIAYSLGDFIFDHYSRKTGETFILKVALTEGGISKIEIIPVYADFKGKPSVVTGKEAKAILDRLKNISIPFKTDINITGDTAEVKLSSE